MQVCPTNLDPEFDVPPNRSYQCSVCGKYGDHYKSICALNTDPNSISQKRKKVARERERLERFGPGTHVVNKSLELANQLDNSRRREAIC